MPLLGPDYGQFDDVVKHAGQLISAATALIYTWTPKKTPKGWEPRKEDLPPWLRWAAVVLVAVGLVLLTVTLEGLSRRRLIGPLIISAVAFCVISLLYLVATFRLTYEITVATKGKPNKGRVVGGFTLVAHARELQTQHESIKQILAGNLFEPDGVWTPGSLLIARVLMCALFVGFLVAGSLLLAMAVMTSGASSAG